jgi:glutamate--cysteine ligase
MSQPKNFGPDETDPIDTPLTTIDQLLELFYQAERPQADWLVGVEYELFGQINRGLVPIPYEGQVSISALFHHLAKKSASSLDPLIPVIEDGNIVALSGTRAIIALEPGGQIEVAAKPHHRLLDVTNTFTAVVKDIRDGARELGVELFALGIHPSAAQKDMAQVKKARYVVMRSYMGSLKGLGLDMMTRSCAIQINLDFMNESDMAQKTRLAAALVPFYSLLCSSVAFIDKKPAPYAVQRGHVWRETDPARTGIPAIIFDKDFGYASWINMVLDVPMYFIRRGSVYHGAHGASFRTFISQGLLGHRASVRDFVDHMSTVFTEIRLKPILELRSPDSLPVPIVNALVALSWALFYDQKARDHAHHIFDGLTHQELVTLRNDVIDRGRKAQFRGSEVFVTAKKLLNVAQNALLDLAPEAGLLLSPLTNLVAKNTTMAEWIQAHFKSLDEDNLPSLIKAFEPFNNPLE